jgi:predicted Fe-S protein YdhL (DUF1289 family)
MPKRSIKSPCIDICALDESDVCIGCYRHGNEISHWGDYSLDQQALILERCELRTQGNFIPYSKPQV